MLVKAGQLDRLQRYVEAGNDQGLLAWWARFQESQGNLQAALEVHPLTPYSPWLVSCMER